MRSFLFLLLMGCGAVPEDTASSCPVADDPCMTDELYEECLSLEESCSGGILILESCPLQFSCA
jgi:hypothetical protein